jgi:hypothetical protein
VLGDAGESYTIRTGVEVAVARRVIRSHLRPWLWWGLAPNRSRPGGVVFGFVVGRFVHARPVPERSVPARFKYTLVVNGRITPWGDGCEVSLRAHAPWLPALLQRAFTIAGGTIAIAAFIATGVVPFLLLGLFFLALGALHLTITRSYQEIEGAEREQLRRWLDAVGQDLERVEPTR